LIERLAIADGALQAELADLRRGNGSFSFLHVCGVLVGLLGAIVGLCDSFVVAAQQPNPAALNATIAAALVALGMGVVLALAAKFVGDSFGRAHSRTAVAIDRLVRPLVLVLN
jgi:biopolymer transport protein ExbB/TolQ